MKNKRAAMISCNDGFRPVSFLLEALPAYQYLFFDLDGTLTQSEYGMVDSIIVALERLGIRGEDREELIGAGATYLAERPGDIADLVRQASGRG